MALKQYSVDMKQRYLFFLLLLFLAFTNCDDVLECVFNKRPEIHDTTFVVGQINTYYYHEITSEIKNEPRDDDYGYSYEIFGDLPEGLEPFANYRTLSIEGMPQTTGVYAFTIYLKVDPPLVYDDDSGTYEASMCSESTSKDFTIIIE